MPHTANRACHIHISYVRQAYLLGFYKCVSYIFHNACMWKYWASNMGIFFFWRGVFIFIQTHVSCPIFPYIHIYEAPWISPYVYLHTGVCGKSSVGLYSYILMNSYTHMYTYVHTLHLCAHANICTPCRCWYAWKILRGIYTYINALYLHIHKRCCVYMNASTYTISVYTYIYI